VISQSKWIPTANWKLAEEIVTHNRIKWAISVMAPFKSAGEDGIYPILLAERP